MDRTSFRKSGLSYLSKFSVNWQKIPEEGWPHLEMSTRLDQKSGKLPVALPSSLTEQSQLVQQLGHNCPCLSIFRTPSWRERLERETRTGDFSLPTSSFCSSQGSVWPKRTHENSPKWAKSCPTSRPKYDTSIFSSLRVFLSQLTYRNKKLKTEKTESVKLTPSQGMNFYSEQESRLPV